MSAASTVAVINERLLDPPRREYVQHAGGAGRTPVGCRFEVFYPQFANKDWCQRLGFGAHADAIIDRIVFNTFSDETGSQRMREHAGMAQ